MKQTIIRIIVNRVLCIRRTSPPHRTSCTASSQHTNRVALPPQPVLHLHGLGCFICLGRRDSVRYGLRQAYKLQAAMHQC